MPILAKPRWEKFAEEIVKGKNCGDAYQAAGYTTENDASAHSAGSRLLKNVEISARIVELHQAGVERAEVTVESLMRELDDARRMAMSATQASAAVSAIREKGILSGKRIERAEHGAPGDFDKMSDNELADFIQTRAARTGTSVPGVGATPGSNGAGKLTH